jgi:carnitine O-acetyltransferase
VLLLAPFSPATHKSVRPLANDAEYAATEKAVHDFLREGGEGEKLQQMLLKHSDAEWAQGRNWLEGWWLQFAYLLWPDPLPLYSNVFFYFLTIPTGDHIFQAARLLTTFLDAKTKIDKEELPVEFTGNLPMDMSQHKRAFTTARIPGLKGDELRVLPPSNNVLVICNHRLFQIPAVDAAGTKICSQVFERLLRQVWAEAHARMPRVHHSVALLTSEKRPVWAQWRKELERDNAATLEAIDRALLVLVLEDEEPSSHDEALRAIAGGDANNRWFDKV